MASSPRIDELRKKFEENPRRYFAPLANEYRKAGEVEQAIAICREYLPQQPGHMSGHIVYGQALYEARQFEEGRTVFETALTLDPENLIALRHLGDIALIVGDSEGARGWYRRVLDADPRNEEIQAQLATLDLAAAGAGGGAVPAPAKPTPSSAPTVVMSAVPSAGPAAAAAPTPSPSAPPPPPPAAPAPPMPRPPSASVTAESPTAEIRLDTIPTHAPPSGEAPVGMALGLEPTSFGGGTQAPAPPVQAIELDSPVSAPQDAPALDSFSLEGLETTSLASEPPLPPLPPPAPPAAPAPAAAAPDLVDLDFGTAAPASPPPAAQPPATVAAPLDLEFAAPTPSAPPAPAPVPASPTPAPTGDDLALLDLGDMPAVPSPAAPAAPAAAAIEAPVVAEPAVEAPMLADFAPPSVPPEDPVPIAEPPATESAPFVTETMAELYLQQGHRDEALRVYRALLERRPNDASLQAKVAELSPAALAPAGPTIRELLNLIALRRPGFRPQPPGQDRSNGATPSAAPATAPGADSLAALFGGAPVSPEDDGAAMALALAFMDLNGCDGQDAAEAPPITGAPAHRAATDLSLDSVFGAQAPPAASPSSFSFDQFFSQRATSEHAVESGASDAVAESPDDVAHFTQWLEGLRQK